MSPQKHNTLLMLGQCWWRVEARVKKGQEKESSSGQRNFDARLKNFSLPNFEGNVVLFWLIEK